jgi:hypothetical protein
MPLFGRKSSANTSPLAEKARLEREATEAEIKRAAEREQSEKDGERELERMRSETLAHPNYREPTHSDRDIFEPIEPERPEYEKIPADLFDLSEHEDIDDPNNFLPTCWMDAVRKARTFISRNTQNPIERIFAEQVCRTWHDLDCSRPWEELAPLLVKMIDAAIDQENERRRFKNEWAMRGGSKSPFNNPMGMGSSVNDLPSYREPSYTSFGQGMGQSDLMDNYGRMGMR